MKRNAIAGHRFASLEALRVHLAYWMREVADTRVHGTTGDVPMQRFEREERRELRGIQGKAPFLQMRELVRCVHTDACVEVDTNRYSVPWRLIGESVTVLVAERQVCVFYAGALIACHAQSLSRRCSVIERSHLIGIVGAPGHRGVVPGPHNVPDAAATELLRPLSEYESILGGAW